MNSINITFWLAGTLFIVLGPLVLIHELGHFICAKLAGVRVEEFGFGFPPRMLKLWRGVGYLDVDDRRFAIPRGFHLPSELEVGDRVDVTARRREDGTYILDRLTRLAPTTDNEVFERERLDEDTHMQGELTILEPGTLYSLNWLPMGAFVKMTGEEDPSHPRSLAAQSKRWRVAILAAGAVLNIIVAVLLITGAYASGYPEKWVVKITDVEPGSAAAEAELHPDDIILAAGGERITDGMTQLRRIIRAAPEQPVDFTILRGEERLSLTAAPHRDSEGYGLLGIWMALWPDRGGLHRYPLPAALRAGLEETVAAIMMTIQAPAKLAQGDITPREARPASIVGISEVMTLQLQQSIEWRLAFPVLQTASLISLALGLTNLLPLPALDGGRILFVLIEALRGRRIPPEREAVVHFVGLVILISLMAFVMFQDIINPIIPWSLLK
mgnify:CR=1 FL=1